MNTQNILGSTEVKDFHERQKSQTILHELGVPHDNSTYSAEAQLLEDPWKIKREGQSRFAHKAPGSDEVWVDCPGFVRGLTDETGTYSLAYTKPQPNRTCDANGDNNRMKRVCRDGKDWTDDSHCARANAFSLLKIEGKVYYLGREGKGSLHIRRCFIAGEDQKGGLFRGPTDQMKQRVKSMAV